MARRKKKSLNDIAEQIGRINRSYNTWRHRGQIQKAEEKLQGEALNRTEIGRLMRQLSDVEGSSYSNASQRLYWLSQAGNKEARAALRARGLSKGLVVA